MDRCPSEVQREQRKEDEKADAKRKKATTIGIAVPVSICAVIYLTPIIIMISCFCCCKAQYEKNKKLAMEKIQRKKEAVKEAKLSADADKN